MFKKLNEMLLKSKLAKIKWIIMDVDGVLSDGKIIIRDDGIENKNFNVKDGWAINFGKKNGLQFAVISGRNTPALQVRFKEQLKIEELHTGKEHNKLEVLKIIQEKYSLSTDEITFIGDDFIDLKPMKYCAVSFAPSNAETVIKKRASYVTKMAGGEGAVREVITMILKAKGVYEDAIKKYT